MVDVDPQRALIDLMQQLAEETDEPGGYTSRRDDLIEILKSLTIWLENGGCFPLARYDHMIVAPGHCFCVPSQN